MDIRVCLLEHVIFGGSSGVDWLVTGRVWEWRDIIWVLLRLFVSLFFGGCGELFESLFGCLFISY